MPQSFEDILRGGEDTPQEEPPSFFTDTDRENENQLAAQRLAERSLVDIAQATGESSARETRQGRFMETYHTPWSEVQQRLEELHPNAQFDMDQAREQFGQIRDEAYFRGLGRQPGPGEGERDWARTPVSYAPFLRHAFSIAQDRDQRAVRNRIAAGQGTQQDYFEYYQRLRHERYEQDRPTWQQGVEALAAIPTYMAEFGPAMKIFGAVHGTRTAAGAFVPGAVTSWLGESFAARAAGAGIGTLAGAAGQPLNLASSIYSRMNPHVGEADADAIDAFKGILDHYIETATELTGTRLAQVTGQMFGGAAL